MKIASLLNEDQQTNTGTVRGLPVDKDLIYKARNKYPGYSSEQAMILLIADEMKNQEKTDSNQNTLIDTQKRENERLRSVVNDLGQTVEQEIQQVAQQAEINDREIERIKSLTGQLSQGGTDTERKAKISGNDLEKLEKELEILKAKPGIDLEKVKKLEAQVKQVASNPSFDNEELNKLENIVTSFNSKQVVSDDLYKKAFMQLQRSQQELIAKEKRTQQELDSKEERFKKYIAKKGSEAKTSAEEIKNYADIVQGYKSQIDSFGDKMSSVEQQLAAVKKEKDITYQLRAEAQQDAQSVADMKDAISAKLELINNITSKLTTGQAQNDPNVEEPLGPGPNAGVLNTMAKGREIEKNITKGAEQMIGRKIAEGVNSKPIKPLQTYKNPKYNEWITNHLPALVQVFKNKYWRDLEEPESQYSDEQIQYIIEKYTPMLYNLGDDKTPLTAKQVDNWLIVVKNKLWEQPVENQLDLFNESLDKTYARMLDDIIGLAYIKKG